MKFAVVNESKSVTPDQAALMVKACAFQLQHHFAPAWSRATDEINIYPNEVATPPDCILIVIFDHSDQADALAYHAVTPKGRPYGRVFAKDCISAGGKVLDGPGSVASALSHEVLEAIADPYCNYWVDGPNQVDGSSYALEVCDPVQEDVYPITIDGHVVTVSNFVFPTYFDERLHVGKVDFMGKCPGAFRLAPGGYYILRKGNFSETPVFAEEGKRLSEAKKHPSSRTYKRLWSSTWTQI